MDTGAVKCQILTPVKGNPLSHAVVNDTDRVGAVSPYIHDDFDLPGR